MWWKKSRIEFLGSLNFFAVLQRGVARNGPEFLIVSQGCVSGVEAELGVLELKPLSGEFDLLLALLDFFEAQHPLGSGGEVAGSELVSG